MSCSKINALKHVIFSFDPIQDVYLLDPFMNHFGSDMKKGKNMSGDELELIVVSEKGYSLSD
jgi:hypothetical protein